MSSLSDTGGTETMDKQNIYISTETYMIATNKLET